MIGKTYHKAATAGRVLALALLATAAPAAVALAQEAQQANQLPEVVVEGSSLAVAGRPGKKAAKDDAGTVS